MLTVADTLSQTERVSFVEEVFMMSEGSAERDAVREVLESPIYRDYDPTLHRRRSISLPDEPTVTVTKADRAIHLDLSTVCVVDEKKAQFFTRFDNQRMDNFVSAVGACRRHVPTVARGPHDSMIADALTKRHGNSVTMLKCVKTGQLSIVDEDKELAERQQFREVGGRNLRPHDSTRVKAADLLTGNNDTLLVVQRQYRVPQNSKPTCRRRVSRASFEDMINKRHEERVEGIAGLDVSRSRLL